MSIQPRSNIDRLLNPSSVAIVGISDDPRSFGRTILENLVRAKYPGQIHLVSQKTSAVLGFECVSSIDKLPPGIDAVVLTIPEGAVLDAVTACGSRSVGGVVVFAAGYAEAGPEGAARQRELADAARNANIALMGPNCMGLINFRAKVALTFEGMEPYDVPEGPGVSIVAQSGAMAVHIREALIGRSLPVGCSISTGNEASVTLEDYVDHLLDDPHTQLLAIYAEQIRDPQRFLELARKAREKSKPIVAMLIGRSERSQQAALSHTGSLTGDYAVARTLLQREGVLVPTTVDEMIDVIPLLLRNPRPKGDGIAFLTGSGAFKNLALDFAEDLGLRFPEFTPATVKRLQELIPGYSVAENPLDYSTISIKNPASVAEMIEAVAADTNCDALIVAHVAGSEMHQRNKAKYMLPPVANTDKPSGVAIMGDSNPLHPELVAAAIETGVPFYRSPERLMRAMALVRDLAKELAEPPESINPPSHRRTLGPFPFASGTGITEFEGKRWFRSLGLPVPDGDLASDLDDALRIARRIGFPVALKAQSPELTHKTEAGGVMLNVTSEGALRTAWSQLVDRVTTAQPNLKLTGVLIERMAQKGIELVVGARRDPMWGPVIMVGLGGIWVEALHDVRLLSPSVSRSRIKEELGKLRSAALLNGVRGQPPIDFEAVAEVVELVGGVMRDFPKIKEIDINPLMAYPSGALALDALVICDKSGEVAE